ncbi:MAG: 3-dehydroquinate synthase [Phycisphaerae bacterium]
MEKVLLNLADRSYHIHIGAGLLDHLGSYLRKVAPASKVVLISDQTVFKLYGARAEESLKLSNYEVYDYIIRPGDKSKSLTVASRIYDVLYEAQIERGDPIIALGGGVVGDLAGFVAGTWLRGVPFVQVPTTLQADIDASVGGKTSVNHPRGKNLIGVFYQPKIVLMDSDTLSTLTNRDIRAGLVESIKHAVIKDAAFFDFHERHIQKILSLDRSVLERLLTRNCQIKAEVVSADEREAGLRAILNFGHTIAHAVEVAGNYIKFRHGEAVALGMIGAGFIAAQRGIFPKNQFQRMENVIRQFGLPCRCKNLNFDFLYEIMKRDKKVKDGKIRFILPTRIGQVKMFDDVHKSQIAEAVEYLKG